MARHVSSRLFMLCLATALFAPRAAPQQAGTMEAGLFAQRTAFDEATTLSPATAPGIGGFLGFYVLPNVVVEVGASYAWAQVGATGGAEGDRTSSLPLRARAVFNLPITDDFYALLGAGYVRSKYGQGIDATDEGLSAIAGFKTYIRDRVAFRSDVTVDHVGTPFNDGQALGRSSVSRHLNWQVTAGLSFDVGPGRRVARRDSSPLPALDVADVVVGAVGDDVPDEVADTVADAPVDEIVDDLVDDLVDEVADTVADAPVVEVVAEAVDSVGEDVVDDAVAGAGEEDGDAPEEGEEEEEGAAVAEARVTFEWDSFELTAEARSILDRVAESLLGRPQARVRVDGCTDSTGPRAYDMDLSRERARSVVRHLAGRGVDADRMKVAAFGPDDPVATNGSAEGRRQNRRVELELINDNR